MPSIRLAKAQVLRYGGTTNIGLSLSAEQQPVTVALRRYGKRHAGLMRRLRNALSDDQIFDLFLEATRDGFRQHVRGAFALAESDAR